MQNSNWKIRSAVETELEEILTLYQACTVKMNEACLFNWHESYPDRDTILSDIQKGTLYIIETNRIHGAVALNEDQPAEYKNINWEYHIEPFLVVHRLAIHPEQQGKGYGILLMEFAEDLARQLKCSSIRMDVFTINIPGRTLYQKLGYKELNEFNFPGFVVPFVGLEKKII